MKRYRLYAALLVLAAGLFVPTAAGAVVSGDLEALFTAPNVAGKTDSVLDNRLRSLVDGAVTGSTIRASLGTEAPQSIVDSLLAAQNQRQVTVLALAERCSAKDAAGACLPPPAPLTALANGLTAGRFTWCDQGCLGGLAHSVFYVLDRLGDGRTDVVAQPSGGVTATRHHNVLVASNDVALATAYRGYFGQLVAGTPVTYTGSVLGDDARTEVFFHPRTADPLAAAVTGAVCPGTVRVAAGAFAASRTALVSALAGRKQAGCTVQVVLTDANDALGPLGAAGIQVLTYRPGGCRLPAGGSCEAGGVGSHYVLVNDSVYAGSARYGSTQDDDTVLRVNDPTIVAAYAADWLALEAGAVTLRPDQWPHAALSTANSVATGDQDNAQASASRTGFVAVVWEDDRDATDPASELHSEVFLRLYKDGASRYEKKISPAGTGNWTHLRPDVAVDDNGNVVVAWLDDPDGNGFYNVAVASLNAAGTVAGTAQANADSTGQQLAPAVTIDPDGGGFTVVWEDRAATPFAIRAAGYASITSKRYEVQVNAATAAGGTQRVPDVASDAAGSSVVVWQEDADGNGFFNIGLKVLTAAGGVGLSQRICTVRRPATSSPTPALSMKGTSDRLSRIFFQFSASSSSIVSRRIWSPRPAVSFPLRSTITTSSALRISTCIAGPSSPQTPAQAKRLPQRRRAYPSTRRITSGRRSMVWRRRASAR